MKYKLGIERQDVIDVVERSYSFEADRMTALQSLPIVTEQEIRAKAIEEFASKIKDEIAKGSWKFSRLNSLTINLLGSKLLNKL